MENQPIKEENPILSTSSIANDNNKKSNQLVTADSKKEETKIEAELVLVRKLEGDEIKKIIEFLKTKGKFIRRRERTIERLTRCYNKSKAAKGLFNNIIG